MSRSLTAVLPMTPVSINRLYVPDRKWGGKRLSKEGRKFKVDALTVLKDQWLFRLKEFKGDGYSKYQLGVRAFFHRPRVFTKGFATGNAQEPVKAMDVSNIVKIVEDVVSEITGIDDRYFFLIIVGKEVVDSPEEERTEVYLENLGPAAEEV